MRRLTSCLAASLLIALIATTINAKVRDTGAIADCLDSINLNWEEWLLIEDKTLKAVRKDADGYAFALEKLTKCQEAYTAKILEKNGLQMENFTLNKSNYQKDVEIYNLKNPPWYKHPLLWGVVGLAVGSFVATLALNK